MEGRSDGWQGVNLGSKQQLGHGFQPFSEFKTGEHDLMNRFDD